MCARQRKQPANAALEGLIKPLSKAIKPNKRTNFHLSSPYHANQEIWYMH
jgi:hypothetical protein